MGQGMTAVPKGMKASALKSLLMADKRTRSPYVKERLQWAATAVQLIDIGGIAQKKYAQGWDAAMVQVGLEDNCAELKALEKARVSALSLQPPKKGIAGGYSVYITGGVSNDDAGD